MKKRIVACMLSLTMLLTMTPTVFAANDSEPDSDAPGVESIQASEDEQEDVPEVSTQSDEDAAESEAVAKIGDKAYTTIGTAIAAASANDTITLQADIIQSVSITAEKNIILDLAGHKITYDTGYAIINNGTLTVKDSKRTGQISGKYGISTASNSTTTIEYARIKSVEGAAVFGSKVTGATLNIQGGSLQASDNAIIADNGSDRSGGANTINISGGSFTGKIKTAGYIACGIYAPWNDTVNISGGSFDITNGAGIVARAGHINITGGTFSISGNSEGGVGDKSTTLPCSVIIFDNSKEDYPAKTEDSGITIEGGIFKTTSTINTITVIGDNEPSRISVKGGRFSSIPKEYINTGYTVDKYDSSTVIVKSINSSDTMQAEVDGIKCLSLAAALAIADNNDKVTLLTDVTANNIAAKVKRNVTLDMNGHNITGTGSKTSPALSITVANSTDPCSFTITNSDTNTSANIAAILPLSFNTNTSDPVNVNVNDNVILTVLDGGDNAVSLNKGAYLSATDNSKKFFTNGGFLVTSSDGERIYSTLSAAQTISKNITLLNNLTASTALSIWNNFGNVVLDLNGKTYKSTAIKGNTFELKKGSSIQLKNGTVKGVASSVIGSVDNDTSLVLDNVKVETNGTYGIATSGSYTNNVITIKNSTIKASNGIGIYFPSSGTLTLDNSTINAKTSGVQVCAGSLNVKNSNIHVTSDSIEKTENDGVIEDGAAISVINRAGYNPLGNITIESGTFTAKSGNAAFKAYKWANNTESDFDNINDTIAITGGTFSTDVANYCAPGYITEESNGVYIVKSGTNDTIAKIDAAIKNDAKEDEIKDALTAVASTPNAALSGSSATMDKLAELDSKLLNSGSATGTISVTHDNTISEVKNAALSANVDSTQNQTINIKVEDNKDANTDAAKTAVNGNGDTKALDITMTKQVGNAAAETINTPTAPVVLTFELPEGWSNAQIVYMDGDTAEKIPTTVSNGRVTGIFNHFSTYVLVQTAAEANSHVYDIILTPNKTDVSAGDTITYTVQLKHTSASNSNEKETGFVFTPVAKDDLLTLDTAQSSAASGSNVVWGKASESAGGKYQFNLSKFNLEVGKTMDIGKLVYTVNVYETDNTKVNTLNSSEAIISNGGYNVPASVQIDNTKDVTYHVITVTFIQGVGTANPTETVGWVRYGDSNLYTSLDEQAENGKKLTVPVLSDAVEDGTGGTVYRVKDTDWHLSTYPDNAAYNYKENTTFKTSATYVENLVKLAKVTIPKNTESKALVEITGTITRTSGGDSYVDQGADLKFKLTEDAKPYPGMENVVTVKVGGTDTTVNGPDNNDTYTVDGGNITGDVTFDITQKLALTADDIKIFTKTEDATTTYREYSSYSGNKTLVAFAGSDAATYAFGKTDEYNTTTPTIFKTYAYADYDDNGTVTKQYNHAVLIDPSGLTEITKDAMLTYLVDTLNLNTTKDTNIKNDTITYNYDTNGLDNGAFLDAQATRDFMDKEAGNGWHWTPTDELLLKADVITLTDQNADKHTEASYTTKPDGYVSTDDVNTFLYLHAGLAYNNQN